MTYPNNDFKKKSRSLLIISIIALSLIVATVYGKYNPITTKLQEVNTAILKERKPDLFQININLNDYNLNQIDSNQLEKLYSSQVCNLSKYYSLEELANNLETDQEKDFDKDGLTNAQEMLLNSNPKEKQTQPGFDDVVLYQDSKSPYNSKLINKSHVFYIDKSYLQDEGENISNILNQKCTEGFDFFELFNSDKPAVKNIYQPNLEVSDKGFNLFFKKNIELIKHRELDIYLNAFGDDKTLTNLELENTKKQLDLLKIFIIEKEDIDNYTLLNDFYNKITKLYNSESKEEKLELYKEIISIIKSSQLTL